MTFSNAAPAANDALSPLDQAVINLMAETVLAAPEPVEAAVAILAGAVGHLRGTIGNPEAAAVLEFYAAEARSHG